MNDCIFCKIASSEVPSNLIYQDNNYFVFLDHQPLNPGHCLVIPKKHYRWTYDVPDFGGYWEVTNKIAHAILNSELKPKYISFLTVGNQVPHAHIHIIPRYENDPHREGIDATKRLSSTSEELQEVAHKISKALSLRPDSVNLG